MAENIKFTQDELNSLGELQNNYLRITNALGQVSVGRLNLDAQEQALRDELQSARQTEETLLNQITEKYGPGQLDPTTGVFTPAQEFEESKEESKSKEDSKKSK